jgi:hypothetical protein
MTITGYIMRLYPTYVRNYTKEVKICQEKMEPGPTVWGQEPEEGWEDASDPQKSRSTDTDVDVDSDGFPRELLLSMKKF